MTTTYNPGRTSSTSASPPSSIFAVVGRSPVAVPWPVRADVFAPAGSPVDTAVAAEAPAEGTAAGPTAPAGRLVVDRLPLLRRHAGTSPDLLLTWSALSAPAAVDVVVHLHGYSGRGASMRIVRDKEPISGLDLADPADPTRTGRTTPTLLVLPRGHFFGGRSGAGYTFPALQPPGALDALVADALARLAGATGVRAPRGRLVLTAHSGGGASLMAILRHADPDEVHAFDALYGDPGPLVEWARRRLGRESAGEAALRVLYRAGEGTARHSERVHCALAPLLTDAVRPRFRVERTRVVHLDIPRTYGWRLLADAAADLPGTAPAGGTCVPRRAGEQEATAALGLEDEAGPQIDEVDAFLAARKHLYTVQLVGTNVHVSLARVHKWTNRYTNRALGEGAVLAALNTIYMGGASVADTHKAYLKVVGRSVTLRPATEQPPEDGVHLLILDESAMATIAEVLGDRRQDMTKTWSAAFGEAKVLEFALTKALASYAQMEPLLPEKKLAGAHLSSGLVRALLDKRTQAMIEVARRHPAAAWWRAAFAGNLALRSAEREPTVADFGKDQSLEKWAATVADLAVATRRTLNEQIAKQREDDRRRGRNEHLRPHEVKVEDAAQHILQTYDPTRTETLQPTGWRITGGEKWANIKGEPLFVLGIKNGEVHFQHLVDTRFYRQSLEGFGQEQQYSVLVEAGRKSADIVVGVQYMFGIVGAMFPLVRYGLIATDVLNAMYKLKAVMPQLERHYESARLAYRNIDEIVPGVLPKVRAAVLDPANFAVLSFEHVNAAAWIKVAVRLVADRIHKGLKGGGATAAAAGFLNSVWAGFKKGLSALKWAAIKLVIFGPAVAGSTGVGELAPVDLVARKLKEIGLQQAVQVAQQLNALPEADKKRLGRELTDLVENGERLIELVKDAVRW